MGVVLVLLLILAVSPANSAQNGYGKKFIIAFPENIAYYHPTEPQNKIRITALRDNTSITMSFHERTKTFSVSLQSPYLVDIDKSFELAKSLVTENMIRIHSNQDVIVHTISQKANSTQTALVVPIDHLGTKYQIPPTPRIEAISTPGGSQSAAWSVPERGPFRLTVINGEAANELTLGGADVSLDPHQLWQVWLNGSAAPWSVLARNPVAVLLSHPCAAVTNCTCAMHLAVLAPTEAMDLEFLVPAQLANGAEGESSVLAATKEAETSSLVMSPGPAVFYRPGMLLGLIPARDFASCYVLPGSSPNGYALIVAPADQTAGVHLGKDPLGSRWTEMGGTGYSWATAELKAGTNVVWHDSARMAVYEMGTNEGAVFGNPAAGVSQHADPRGCVLTPEVLELRAEEDGWPESLRSCRADGTELISLHSAELQRHVAAKLSEAALEKKGVKKAWIGLRRSSLTGEWYWLNGAAVNATNWAEGEPGTSQDGQCAAVSLDPEDNFGWRDEDCCAAAPPICYKEPELFPVV